MGRLVHHQRTMRSSVVAARRPGSKGCAPGTAHSGSGQAQPRPRPPRPPAASSPTPGSTGHRHAVAQVRAASSWAGLALRRSRSLRRLPRISRMSARSFPLNAEGPHHTTCELLCVCITSLCVRALQICGPGGTSVPSMGRAESSRCETGPDGSVRTSAARSGAHIAPAVPRCKPRHSGVGAWPSLERTSGPAAGFRGDQNCPWPSSITYPACPK